MIESFKPYYETVLRPIVRLCVRLRMTPNTITLAGVGFFAIAGWLALQGHWQWAAITAGVGACMDGLDGLLARETGSKSVFGAILDSTGDRFTEIELLFGIMIWYVLDGTYVLIGTVVCFAAVTGSLMVSYVRARCEGANVVCRGGIMQRPERIILLVLGLFAGPLIMLYVLGGVAVLSYGTTLGRLWRARKA